MALRGVQRSRSELVIVTGSLFTRSDPIDFRNESCIAQYIRIYYYVVGQYVDRPGQRRAIGRECSVGNGTFRQQK
jgi:hypothetical protein